MRNPQLSQMLLVQQDERFRQAFHEFDMDGTDILNLGASKQKLTGHLLAP
jgi:hypothetical protein